MNRFSRVAGWLVVCLAAGVMAAPAGAQSSASGGSASIGVSLTVVHPSPAATLAVTPVPSVSAEGASGSLLLSLCGEGGGAWSASLTVEGDSSAAWRGRGHEGWSGRRAGSGAADAGALACELMVRVPPASDGGDVTAEGPARVVVRLDSTAT